MYSVVVDYCTDWFVCSVVGDCVWPGVPQRLVPAQSLQLTRSTRGRRGDRLLLPQVRHHMLEERPGVISQTGGSDITTVMLYN